MVDSPRGSRSSARRGRLNQHVLNQLAGAVALRLTDSDKRKAWPKDD